MKFDLIFPADYDALILKLKELRTLGKPMYAEVKRRQRKRTLDQNKYYWGVVIKSLSEHTGYTPGEMHEELLGAYVGWETRTFRGHTRLYPRRTSTTPETMETLDFAGLIEMGYKIGAELGIYIPSPEKA